MKLLGDLISDAMHFLGVEECDRCKRRKKKLNAADARVRARVRRKPCVECQKAKRI